MNRKKFLSLGLASLGASALDLHAGGVNIAWENKALPKMISLAKSKLGVQVGGGECTDFISWLVKEVGAKAPNFAGEPYYTWGMPIKGTGSAKGLVNKCQLPGASPGVIMQFVNCEFKTANSDNQFPKHTALVVAKSGSVVTLIHQNVNQKRFVQESTLDLSTLVTPTGKGEYTLFVVVPA